MTTLSKRIGAAGPDALWMKWQAKCDAREGRFRRRATSVVWLIATVVAIAAALFL